MKIKQLKLQNYGRFEDLTIDFAPTEEKSGNVTVIVGNNGAGKSQILQGLATGLSWFVANLKVVNSKGFLIVPLLIKNGKNDSLIQITSDFGKSNYGDDSLPNLYTEWQIASVREGRVSQLANEISQLELAASSYQQQLTQNEKFSLPLVVFYPVERTVLGYVDADIISHGYDQFKGYHASLEGASIDFSDFLKWFRYREDIDFEYTARFERRVENDFEKIKKRIVEIEEYFNRLEINENVAENVRKLLEIELKKTKQEFKGLKDLKRYKDDGSVSSRDLTLGYVKSALSTFTGFNNFHIRRQGTPTMIVEKDGEELDVNQLSQGEKSLLALVGDIARRLAILNPSLANPLEGEGVVMIDEVDLHLHPKWQHDLIDKLVRTFPNVQFILTTHSPHVISDRSGILVYSLNDGEIEEIPNVYGQDVNTVLTKVFDVDIRDSEVEVKLNNIRRAISHKDYLSAEKGIKELSEKMPADDVELLKCRLMLAQAKVNDKKDNELEHADD